MQTKCHADLPQTRSAQFILEYMNCTRVFKALLGHGEKKKEEQEKKVLQFYLCLCCCPG